MTNENNKSVLMDFLVEQGHITEEQKQELHIFAQQNNCDIFTAITDSNIIKDKNAIIKHVAESFGLDFVDLNNVTINPEAVKTLTKEKALQLKVLPYEIKNDKLYIAVPIGAGKSVRLKDDLRMLTQHGVIEIIIASKPDIIKHIEKLYRSDAELEAISDESANTNTAVQNEVIPDEVTAESKVVRFVNLVLQQAVKDGASDIHFDPQEHGLVVRYRIDGVLQLLSQAQTHMIPAITSRIKILSNLDISKTREPQDGRLEFSVDKKPIDFRVATLPAIYGEKIVMRILDNSSTKLALADLGFSETNLVRFRKAAQQPYGVVLVTGPTGSGKSTTLYAALNELNSPDINIITAEDPVEYQLPGITQVAIHQNLSFASVLRTVLRSDPDVILIGEIRDKITAEIAMQAGMTGHMVFSTLHTNDAASALTRLGDMGVQEFITGSTVQGIASQRLVRRLCKACKVAYEPTEAELEVLQFNWDNLDEGSTPTFFKNSPKGCKDCNGNGFKGRLAIHEVLVMSDRLEEAIIRGAKALELHALAVEEGMIPLQDDGYIKVAQGLTTFTEIAQVVASRD